jgi:hypothetical protein
LREERESREGGSVGGKRRKLRGFLAKPPFLSPSSVQNREGGEAGAASVRRRAAASRGRRRPVIDGKQRGDRGDLIPVLTLGWGCLGRRLRGAVWAAAAQLGRRWSKGRLVRARC